MALGVLIVVGLAVYVGRHELARRMADLPPFTHRAGDRAEVMVRMSDGVELYTTVQLPRGDGPFPTVLVRSPYPDVNFLFRNMICGRFVRYGYACVLQDVRGQGRSGGDWDPGTNNEIADGRVTLDWLVRQDFQDGNIAMVGSSFLASVQYAALAGGAPAELKTIVPAMFATDIRGVMYQDGLFRHETYTAWASMMRRSNGGDTGSDAGDQYQRAIRYRPHKEIDTAVYGVAMPWYREMLSAMSPASEYWQAEDRVRIRELPANIEIPLLMIGGWYDVFFGPQFDDWQRLATRSKSRYIIGPWAHSGSTGEYETPGADGGTQQWPEMLPWLEHHLKGAAPAPAPGVKLYVIGENEWVHRSDWPTTTSSQTWYLSALEQATECSGGRLASTPGEGAVSFRYDPDDPVPTRGGSGMLAYNLRGYDGAPPVTVEQSGLCERDDVLTFRSEAIPKGLLIAGTVSVTLDVASSAPDTAFTAKLIEVLPDGRSFNIRDSITSLAYRNGSEIAQQYTPGERVSVTLDFWPIAWRLQPGSHLRLDVSSSDFPKFHAHTNRAGPWADQTGADVAEQVVYGGLVEVPVESAKSLSERRTVRWSRRDSLVVHRGETLQRLRVN